MTAMPRPTNRTPALPELLAVDTKALAKMLCCSIRHVERQDVAGKLPAPVRIGYAKRWSVEEIKRWLAAGAPERRTWLAMKAAGGAK